MKKALLHSSQDVDCDSMSTIADLSAHLHNFRRAFRKRERPSIEAVLDTVHQGLRTQLFSLLLVEELLWRKRSGDNPPISEYYTRFPSFQAEVDAAWSKVNEVISSSVREGNEECDRLLVEAEPLLVDTEPERFGLYVVQSKLGEGNFGSVYKAIHELTSELVAIKMLKPAWCSLAYGGTSMREQFITEAKTMLGFQHPNIVKVLAMDEFSNPPYFAQTFIDGPTLQQVLRDGRLPVEKCLNIAIQIAEALSHIHSQERWHRDLKPADILIDQTNKVYVTDFGLALEDAHRWTLPGSPAGTYPYMAPEQVRGDTHLLNAKCDLWALGVILYEMLTGKRPFNGRTQAQLCKEILERCPSAPRDFDACIPRELSRLCMTCLAKKDADRPDSAADLRDELISILGNLELETRAKPSGSKKTVKVWMLGIVATLAAVTVISTLMIRLVDLSDSPLNRAQLDVSEQAIPAQSVSTERLLKDFSVWVVKHGALPEPLDNDMLPLHAGNELKIKIEFSRPAYFYLLWIADDGEASLLPSSANGSSLGPVTSFDSPQEKLEYWTIEGSGGNEMILLLMSESELPEFDLDEIRSTLPQATGRPILSKAICYQATRFETTRSTPLGGDTRSLSSKPSTIDYADEVLLDRLRERFDAVFAMRIPIARESEKSSDGPAR